MVEVKVPQQWENREGIGEYDIRWNWVTRPSVSGLTAVLRVRNEASSLPWVLPGVLRSVERVIVVDNLSTDGTPQLAKKIAAEEGLEDRLRLRGLYVAAQHESPSSIRGR
jgi:hypothetical protein